MKTCIGTYSYQQEFDKGSFTRFDAIDYTKKLGMDGVELVLHDDRVPEGYTFASYTKALADSAREIGLDVPTFQIISALHAAGYDGYVSIEFEGMEDNLPALEIGAENLQRMIKDAAR